MYFSSHTKTGQSIPVSTSSAMKVSLFGFADAFIIDGLLSTVPLTIFVHPSPNLISETTMPDDSLILRELLVVCFVSKMLLASKKNIFFAFDDTEAKIFVALHNNVFIIVFEELHKVPLTRREIARWFLDARAT